jgi:hypothetical protein
LPFTRASTVPRIANSTDVAKHRIKVISRFVQGIDGTVVDLVHPQHGGEVDV